MPELTAADVENFTGGRLQDDGGTGEVSRMLDAALGEARDATGWHVAPVRRDTITLDGPRDRVLMLPTMRLVELISVTENGVELDLDTLHWSHGRPPGLAGSGQPARIRKRNYRSWSWDYGSIEIVMEHGIAEDAGWRQAILFTVDQMSMLPVGDAGRSAADLTRKEVDDVAYSWTADYRRLATDTIYSVRSILDRYTLDGIVFR